MAKIKTVNESDTYIAMHGEAAEVRETNDCAVKAIAIACGVKYGDVRNALKAEGRKERKGTYRYQIANVIKSFGYNIRLVEKASFIGKYSGRHANLKSVTTHHPDRFHDVWADGNSYLFFTSGHVLAVVDGVNHDHTRGKAKRVISILKIVKEN